MLDRPGRRGRAHFRWKFKSTDGSKEKARPAAAAPPGGRTRNYNKNRHTAAAGLDGQQRSKQKNTDIYFNPSNPVSVKVGTEVHIQRMKTNAGETILSFWMMAVITGLQWVEEVDSCCAPQYKIYQINKKIWCEKFTRVCSDFIRRG